MDHSIITADCLDALPALAEASVSLTLFSPPYDAIRDYKGEWTIDLPSLGDEIYRVTVDGGICVVVIQDGTKDFAKSLATARIQVDWVDRVGWRLFECVIYERHGRPGAWWGQRFRVDHEYILIFFKGKRPRHFDKSHLAVASKGPGETMHGTQRRTDGTLVPITSGLTVGDTKCRGTIWRYATSNSEGNARKLEHPATFPDRLASDVIECFTRTGDLVLDPMCGSGTTCRMAKRAGRRSIGVEIDPTYAALARALLDVEQERLL